MNNEDKDDVKIEYSRPQVLDLGQLTSAWGADDCEGGNSATVNCIVHGPLATVGCSDGGIPVTLWLKP